METSRITYFALGVVLLAVCAQNNVEGIRRFRRPPLPGPPPPPVVKVGQEVITLKAKPSSGGAKRDGGETVDIAPLLETKDEPANRRVFSKRPTGGNFFILRRKTASPRSMSGFTPSKSVLISGVPTRLHENSRSFRVASRLQDNSRWLALQLALRRQRQRDLLKSRYLEMLETSRNAQYLRSIAPLLEQYKLQKNAADKYYEKYLRTLQLLALATSTNPVATPPLTQTAPELGLLAQSFGNSIYGSLLKNSSFVTTESVHPGLDILKPENSTDQAAEASERSDHHLVIEHNHELSTLYKQLEREKRKLLDVFPPPQSEVPFGERTILMVRFPPVPQLHSKDEKVHLKTAIDIDGGVSFGGPRWFSFGKPYDPFDHPWYHEHHNKKDHHHKEKYVLKEADKQSSNGVIISQNFIHRPKIGFTNSDPKNLAKHKGDVLNGGPSIVAQLAKALAEGNRISNSYFLSKNLLGEKKWAHPGKKPPFVIVHLDTYTKMQNDTDALGIEDQLEMNYANGTIIYPTKNDPNLLASTKFEFHSAHEIEHIFDHPLAVTGHGWTQVPVYPKGIREIKNFLRLMYKVHQASHDRGRRKIYELKKLGLKQEKPAFPDSKPLLKTQMVDKSINWLHTSSVGIRSLSEDDDHFPYDQQPVVDVSKDYQHIDIGHYLV